MKDTLRTIFVYSMILYIVTNLFQKGIDLPENLTYLFLSILILSFTLLVVCPLLSFLAIKCNFLPFFLMSSILLVGIFFILKAFMPDFYIETYMFEGLDFGGMEIKSFEFLPVFTIVACSVASSFLCSIYRELDKN